MFKVFLYKWKGSLKNPRIHPYKCGQSVGVYGRYPFLQSGISIGLRWGFD